MHASTICLDDVIPYHNVDEWRSYLKELYKLYLITSHIVGFIDKELDKYKDMRLSQIYSRQDSFSRAVLNIVLGGLTSNPDNPFKERSVSRFYYEVYGFGITEEQAKRLLLELGKRNIEAALKDICIQKNDSEVLQNIRRLRELLRGVFAPGSRVNEIIKYEHKKHVEQEVNK